MIDDDIISPLKIELAISSAERITRMSNGRVMIMTINNDILKNEIALPFLPEPRNRGRNFVSECGMGRLDMIGSGREKFARVAIANMIICRPIRTPISVVDSILVSRAK